MVAEKIQYFYDFKAFLGHFRPFPWQHKYD